MRDGLSRLLGAPHFRYIDALDFGILQNLRELPPRGHRRQPCGEQKQRQRFSGICRRASLVCVSFATRFQTLFLPCRCGLNEHIPKRKAQPRDVDGPDKDCSQAVRRYLFRRSCLREDKT